MLRAIKIIHSWNQIKEYRFLSDYFRMMGIYICGYTPQTDCLSSDFDVVIILKKDMDKNDVEMLEERYPKAIKQVFNVDKTKLNDDYLKEMVQAIRKNRFFSAVEVESMEELAEIYYKRDLSYHRNAYDSFYNNRIVMQRAQDAFVDACIDLNHMSVNKKETVYYLYAAAYLRKYTNETCRTLNQHFLFLTESILKILDQALRLQPFFTNAYLLKGMIAELDRDIRKDAGAYYKIALEQLYEKPYASYSYYVIGKYYEKSRKMSKAVELYTWSLRLNNFEYRVIYELAVHDIRNKNYKGALERLKMIHNILNKKEVANYLQPKEYTYLFKIYLELENVYGDKFFEIQKYKESVQRIAKMILYTGESEAIGISPTPIDFIEEQELFIHDSDGTYPLVSSYSFKWKNEMG